MVKSTQALLNRENRVAGEFIPIQTAGNMKGNSKAAFMTEMEPFFCLTAEYIQGSSAGVRPRAMEY